MIDQQQYTDAVKFVVEKQRVSISAIQRRLRIGYNRAAEILEEMVVNGVVSEPGQNGAREVLWSVGDLPHVLQDFQKRVVDEKAGLDSKITSLDKFINEGDVFKTLPSDEQRRLISQIEAMESYSFILGERIEEF